MVAPDAQATRKLQKNPNQGTYLPTSDLHFPKLSKSRKTEKLFQIEEGEKLHAMCGPGLDSGTGKDTISTTREI